MYMHTLVLARYHITPSAAICECRVPSCGHLRAASSLVSAALSPPPLLSEAAWCFNLFTFCVSQLSLRCVQG